MRNVSLLKVNKIAAIIFLSFLLPSCAGSKKAAVADPGVTELAGQGVGSALWFQTSAEMKTAYLQAFQYGRVQIERKLSLKKYNHPAVIFDIDETLLDNSPYQAWLIHNGKTYSSETWKDWTQQARAEALPGALEFIAFLRGKGIDVFYVSNRRVSELDATMRNMAELGFPQVIPAHMLLREDTSDKTARRETVMQDHEVLLYVGDNLGDFSHLFDTRGTDLGKDLVDRYRDELLNNFLILPNPMYGEWERALLGNETGLGATEQIERRKKALKE